MNNLPFNKDKLKKPTKKEITKQKNENKSSLPVRRIVITDRIDDEISEKLERKVEHTREKLKQIDLAIDLEKFGIDLKDLNFTLVQLVKYFGRKTWFHEIESHINATIKTQLSNHFGQPEEKGLRAIILAAGEAGVEARREKRYDIAIEILQDINEQLIPELSKGELSVKVVDELRSNLSKELAQTFMEKGDITKAIKCINEQCEIVDSEEEEYIECSLKKTQLLIQKGEFKQAVEFLQELLIEKQNNPKQVAEIKRGLGMACRGQGAFEEALAFFKEAEELYKKIDKDGYYNTLWGMGILHHLRGEWEPAIDIWEKLLTYFETKKNWDSETTQIFMYSKVYFEYFRTLELCGRLQEAEQMMKKAILLVPENNEETELLKAKLSLILSEFYSQQGRLDEATETINKVKQLNAVRTSNRQEAFSEIKILKPEVLLLLALNKADLAREKLEDEFKNLKSNWDRLLYYRLLGKIEKKELNFGLAKKAFKSALEITREIGASTLSDELQYIELLVEMSKTGNMAAYEEAKVLLVDFEEKVTIKKIPTLLLESKLLSGHLECVTSNFDKAYPIYSDVLKESDRRRLFRQKTKALESLSLLEKQGRRLSETHNLSVMNYLEDARRILEEYS